MKKNLVIIFALYAAILALGLGLRSVTERSGEEGEEKVSDISRILEQSFAIEPARIRSLESFESAEAAAEEAQKLVIEDVKPGEGLMAEAGDVVSINYTGMFEDGTVFDSSESPGRAPFQFTLGAGQVIEGWERGVPGMRVGGVRKLIVPASLAYGEEGFGVIPPDATLVFEIELLSVFEE